MCALFCFCFFVFLFLKVVELFLQEHSKSKTFSLSFLLLTKIYLTHKYIIWLLKSSILHLNQASSVIWKQCCYKVKETLFKSKVGYFYFCCVKVTILLNFYKFLTFFVVEHLFDMLKTDCSKLCSFLNGNIEFHFWIYVSSIDGMNAWPFFFKWKKT